MFGEGDGGDRDEGKGCGEEVRWWERLQCLGEVLRWGTRV